MVKRSVRPKRDRHRDSNPRRDHDRTTTTAPKIDPDRVHTALASWDREPLLDLALALLDAVPKTRQARVLADFLPVDDLCAVPIRATTVLAEVKQFHAAALAREYFETFRVDSRNYKEQSVGTRRFIAEFDRLAERTAKIRPVSAAQHALVCEAFALLLDLHRRVDALEDIIFLADEHGAYQIGCPWYEHLPRWFTALAATTDPDAYAAEVLRIIEVLAPHDPADMLAAALRAADPRQKRVLRCARPKTTRR